MRGKLIIIEGTDCSGKQTQSELIIKKLNEKNIKAEYFSFPNYDSPTGKIIGGPYLGKEYISKGWFKEGATNVDPLVASLYYTADRIYNISKIEALLSNGINVILDRYSFSNMAHQGGKITDKNARFEMYKKLDDLEFGFANLPNPDVKVLLYMPYEQGELLRNNREEKLDEHERDKDHLKLSLNAYLEVAEIYNFMIINCTSNNTIRTIEDINEQLYNYIISSI